MCVSQFSWPSSKTFVFASFCCCSHMFGDSGVKSCFARHFSMSSLVNSKSTLDDKECGEGERETAYLMDL